MESINLSTNSAITYFLPSSEIDANMSETTKKVLIFALSTFMAVISAITWPGPGLLLSIIFLGCGFYMIKDSDSSPGQSSPTGFSFSQIANILSQIQNFQSPSRNEVPPPPPPPGIPRPSHIQPVFFNTPSNQYSNIPGHRPALGSDSSNPPPHVARGNPPPAQFQLLTRNSNSPAQYPGIPGQRPALGSDSSNPPQSTRVSQIAQQLESMLYPGQYSGMTGHRPRLGEDANT